MRNLLFAAFVLLMSMNTPVQAQDKECVPLSHWSYRAVRLMDRFAQVKVLTPTQRSSLSGLTRYEFAYMLAGWLDRYSIFDVADKDFFPVLLTWMNTHTIAEDASQDLRLKGVVIALSYEFAPEIRGLG